MDNVRYFKLKNTGGFVVRIIVLYKEMNGDDGQGNISYSADWKEWKPSGYHDICATAERTVDLLNDANLPDHSLVKLKVFVVAGKDKTSSEQYIYSASASETASYQIHGSTLFNSLEKTSYC